MNNETIGISVEEAISKYFNCKNHNTNSNNRVDDDIVKQVIKKIEESDELKQLKIKEFIGKNRNKYDFITEDGRTISIKSNKQKLGKICPQKIGQTTSKRFFEIYSNLDYSSFNKDKRYEYFKKLVFNKEEITNLLTLYWENCFCCSELVVFYNFESKNIKYVLLNKEKNKKCPFKNSEKISFTQTESSWNESCTIKYDGISIGEFQLHSNRDCIKFRFNFNNLIKKGWVQ